MPLWGKTDAVADRPNWINLSNYPAGTTLVFVDEQEAQVDENKDRGLTAAGWWLYRTYTDGNGATRHKAECVVALRETAAAAGDDTDDAIAADLSITISAHPLTQGIAADSPVSLFVTASANSDTPLTYQWQESADNITYTDITGETASTYTSGNLAAGTYYYKVVINCGGLVVESNVAVITAA